MRYSQLIAPGRSAMVETTISDPGPGDVQIEIRACGVCASELNPWADERPSYPVRFGHEPVGIVTALGPGVDRFTLGDRVTGHFGGAFSEVCVAPAAALLPVPASLADESALGEPLACLVNAARRTPVEFADRVAVVGLGFMGLGILQLLKLRGPSRLIAIDPREEARQHAAELGADETYVPEDVPAAYQLTEFREWNGPNGLDVVVEASGTQAGLTLAGRLVRAHGLLSILGFNQGGDRRVDVEMWNWKAIDVVNAHVRRRADPLESMRIGLELEASGQIDLGRLVTHRFSLDDVDAAYTALRDKPPGFIKAVIYPGKNGG